MAWGWWVLIVVGALLAAVAIYDVLQKKKAVLHNFPVIGHLRYIFESVGPELRQYIVTRNDEERPFTRDQRRWVYASAKKQDNYFGYGTDNDLESASNYILVKHAAFPVPAPPSRDGLELVPCAKVWGQARGRAKAFRPESIVCLAGLSYGALSARAIEALNRGAKLARALHNTGEGGISPFHDNGGDLVFQIGTGYFGVRDRDGRFDLARLKDVVARHPVKAIEIKLSQGAEPGRGALLPARKVTPLVAEIRDVPVGRDVYSPPHHTAFSDVDSLLDFVERLAGETGLPVGIKSAVGDGAFWQDLARLMDTTQRGVDFIHVDGGEGGTGAAPLVFTDHVALPFKLAFARVFPLFAERGLDDKVVFIGAGRLGFPAESAFAMALGCDMIAVAREAMLAIGCIQAQQCHTNRCPSGVTSHHPWLMRGLDPSDKSARLANYLTTLRQELMWLVRATGKHHPYELVLEDFEVLGPGFRSELPRKLFDYRPEWRQPRPERVSELRSMMNGERA